MSELVADFHRQNNAKYFWHPMSHPRDMQLNKPIVIAKGEDVYITDIDGHRTLDGVGGLWCVNLGYSNAAIIEAMEKQVRELPYYNCFRGSSNTKAIELSLELKNFFVEEGLTRAFYTSGGSDSVEVALKISRQYHQIRGDGQRTKFIAFSAGYHGTHCGGSSLCGSDRFRNAYKPLLDNCYHVPSPCKYRNPFAESDSKAVAVSSLSALRSLIAQEGAESFAAIIMEPVIGSGGVIVPDATFMPGVRDLCHKNGILLIADEVVTAFGRTGSWTGSRLWGVQPDILTCAKGITNGFFPFGVCMFSQQIAQTFENDSSAVGTLTTGYTYSGHPIGAAIAIATLAETKRLNIADNVLARGKEMMAGLLKLKQKYSVIGDIRGVGLMHAIELVADENSKQPLAKESVAKIFQTIYLSGLMVRISSNLIIISPPLIFSQQHICELLDKLDKSFLEHSH